MKNPIKDKTILITGGTGSFGNSMTSKLLDYKPRRIVIFSRDEKKQFDMRNKFNNSALKFVIGDVRDPRSLEKAMISVDYIFHAAALKQVPTCEFFPIEAVKTNVLGTFNVLSAAIKSNIKKVVVLSTDKAVYPINAMGMTKALMEKTMIAEAKTMIKKRTIFCGVRYGNVLYSRGSVIPHFVDQVKKKQPLTVTDPKMTRFLLPLFNAVDLVLYAFNKGEEASIYVKKAPAATIETLANAINELFKSKKGIKKVGIRNGEKIHETLISKEEMLRTEDHSSYFRIQPEEQDLDYKKYFTHGRNIDVEKIQPYTSENTTRLNKDQTIKLLLTLPEFKKELNKK